MNELDRTIKELDPLMHRKVIRELASLVKLYIRARAQKGAGQEIKRKIIEAEAMLVICTLSDAGKSVLEAALKS